MNLGILNFDIGNLKSIIQILKKIPIDFNLYIIKKDLNNLNKIDKLIIPGQGSSYIWLKNFINIDFEVLNYVFINKLILGICVGKHIFFNKTDEFNNLNLNFINGLICRLKLYKKFNKIPHIGWNKVFILKNHFIFNNMRKINLFYFSHSFYLLSKFFNNNYGMIKYNIFFNSIFIKKNICLTQFHPEKSGIQGFRMFYNFCYWNI